MYFQKNHKEDDIYIAKAEYYKQGYGFAFKKKNDLVNEANLSLLELAENHKVTEIVNNYLGEDQD